MQTERKLIPVERGNVVLKVPEYDVQRYIDQGYSLLDENGVVIKQSIPREVGALQKAFVDHIREIESLKKQVDELQKQLAKKKSASKTKT